MLTIVPPILQLRPYSAKWQLVQQVICLARDVVSSLLPASSCKRLCSAPLVPGDSSPASCAACPWSRLSLALPKKLVRPHRGSCGQGSESHLHDSCLDVPLLPSSFAGILNGQWVRRSQAASDKSLCTWCGLSAKDTSQCRLTGSGVKLAKRFMRLHCEKGLS